MKQTVLKLTALCFALMLFVGSCATVFAEEVKNPKDPAKVLVINKEAAAEVGQIVTYTLYLSEATDPIVGFELRLFYDKDRLEYQKSSLKFEKFEAVIFNENIPGKLPMNCSSLSNLPDYSKKGQFLSASFKVLQGGEATISYFITELYGEDLEYLKSYHFTYDLTAGDEVLIKDGVPPVNNDQETLEKNQGDFVNYEDGMGENNSPLTPEEHKRVGSAVQSKIVEVTRTITSTGDSAPGSGGFFGSGVFYLIIGALFVGVIVAAVVIISIKSKKQ